MYARARGTRPILSGSAYDTGSVGTQLDMVALMRAKAFS
jgi:hypothetical protein